MGKPQINYRVTQAMMDWKDNLPSKVKLAPILRNYTHSLMQLTVEELMVLMEKESTINADNKTEQ